MKPARTMQTKPMSAAVWVGMFTRLKTLKRALMAEAPLCCSSANVLGKRLDGTGPSCAITRTNLHVAQSYALHGALCSKCRGVCM